MSDDGITITIRASAHVVSRPGRYVVIRHTKRTWFRMSRADRNRLRRCEPVRDSAPWPRYRRTRAMRDAIAAHTRNPD